MSDFTIVTQWSQVLDPRGDHAQTIAYHRRAADLLEKGGGAFLGEFAKRKVMKRNYTYAKI